MRAAIVLPNPDFPLRLWQLALAVLAGNLVAHQLPALPSPLLVLALLFAALGVIARCRLPGPTLLALAVLAFCWTVLVARSGLAARWPPAADGDDVALIGWIDSLPRREAGRTVFSLRVTDGGAGVPLRRVRLSWYEPAPALAAGQTLAIEARLRSPRGLVNPGAFDYERWLFLERYDATGYVRSGRIESLPVAGLAQSWLGFRAGLVDRLKQLVADPDAAALITALSLGERSAFEDRHWTVLQRTGTSHLVAVSGLHIGLIAAFFYLLTLRLVLWLPYALARHAHSFAAGFCIVPASFYAALAGFGLPTRRAVVMLLVAQVLIVARRRWPLGSGLGLALIAVLLIDPLASLTASFWLSFGAVALLLAAATGTVSQRKSSRIRFLAGAVEFARVQWALTLGLAPLVIWFFGQVSLVSLFVNFLAIPVFGLVVVPLSLLTALCAAAGSSGFGLVPLANAVAGLAWRVLELAAATPLAAFDLPPPPISALLLSLGAIALAVPRHGLPGRRFALLGLVPLALDHSAEIAPGELRATVLDVGHGLAVVIETERHRALYDTGPLLRSGFDAGAEIVAPALSMVGRKRLDLLVLSHGDSDHAGGAASVLARYPQARILAGPDIDNPAAEVCREGQAWVWDQVRFRILHPPSGFRPQGNESSCVLRIETLAGSLLLTGDIERRAESSLESGATIAADVVIVPHHGSLTSSTATFVASVQPRLAIVSAGFKNRWDLPRSEVRERWEEQGATLLVTGDLGAIDVHFRVGGIDVKAARHLRSRYWQAKPDPVSGAIDWSAL